MAQPPSGARATTREPALRASLTPSAVTSAAARQSPAMTIIAGW
jgi:hypothetical protein